jgi:hypothetical protein
MPFFNTICSFLQSYNAIYSFNIPLFITTNNAFNIAITLFTKYCIKTPLFWFLFCLHYRLRAILNVKYSRQKLHVDSLTNVELNLREVPLLTCEIFTSKTSRRNSSALQLFNVQFFHAQLMYIPWVYYYGKFLLMTVPVPSTSSPIFHHTCTLPVQKAARTVPHAYDSWQPDAAINQSNSVNVANEITVS